MSKEHKVLVGLGTPLVPGQPHTVILGMTPAGWEFMQSGETHTMDLRKAGLDLQIIICRGETHAELGKQIEAGAVAAGAKFTDTRKPLPDLGIDPVTEQ